MEKLSPKTKEGILQLLYTTAGSMIYAIGLNTLITPLGLYNGGFMGIAQLIRTFLVEVVHVPVPAGVDLAGILYFILNVPLFYLGLKVMGKAFTVKSLYGVTIISICLVLVRVPQIPIIDDYLTACMIGGIIAGCGSGIILRARSTAGGPDIIGVCCAKKYPNLSVGKVTLTLNIVVYTICLFLYNIEIVVYSLIFATVFSLTVDKVHIQNINTSVMIFTKKTGISDAILKQTGRGVTNWDGEGAYTHKTSYILFVMVSKYEVNQIKHIVHSIDPNAFMIFTEGCQVDGNFEKRL